MADQDETAKGPWLERHPKIYEKMFSLLHWWATKVMKIPFGMLYQPDGGRILAITYSWSLEYAQRLKNNWDLQERYNKIEHQLTTANSTIAELTDQLERAKK